MSQVNVYVKDVDGFKCICLDAGGWEINGGLLKVINGDRVVASFLDWEFIIEDEYELGVE